MMRLASIQVGLPRTVDAAGKPWETGFFKELVVGPVWLGRTNLVGDGQADLRNHGGPDKAVNVYAAEHYPVWSADLGLPEFPAGGFGENFTVLDALEADVCVGDVYDIGGARVQVSQPRQPCWKLARRWGIKDLALRVQQTMRTGWYFRVLREGEVAAGLPLTLVGRPHPEWTVAAANAVMHHDKGNLAAAAALAACPALSASWRGTLSRRAATGVLADTAARLAGPLKAPSDAPNPL